jgi:hypothetical protein
MRPVTNPVIGQSVWIDVMGNGAFCEFVCKRLSPVEFNEDDERWEPECWTFEGTGTFYHYPCLGAFEGFSS